MGRPFGLCKIVHLTYDISIDIGYCQGRIRLGLNLSHIPPGMAGSRKV